MRKRWQFLCTDDQSGQFSGTTLRTWILFAIFCLYFVALAVSGFLNRFPDHGLDLLEIMAYVTIGGGALYLGKRFNQRKTSSSASEDFVQRIQSQMDQHLQNRQQSAGPKPPWEDDSESVEGVRKL